MKLSDARLATAVMAGLLLSAIVATAQTDPALGTWSVNAAKSKFTPGPALKSGTVIFAKAGQGIHVVADLVDVTGATQHSEYTANYDGKDYPLKGVPIADMVSLKRIDARSTQRADKKAGKVVQTYDRTVSADGKTLTVIQKGTDAKGKAFNNTIVFEKK